MSHSALDNESLHRPLMMNCSSLDFTTVGREKGEKGVGGRRNDEGGEKKHELVFVQMDVSAA